MGTINKMLEGNLDYSVYMLVPFLHYFLKSDCAFKQNWKAFWGLVQDFFSSNLSSAAVELHLTAVLMLCCNSAYAVFMSASVITEHGSTLDAEVAQIIFLFSGTSLST